MSSILKGLSETKKDEKGFMPTPRQVPAPPGGHPVPPGYERVKSWGGGWELRKKKEDKATDEGYSAGAVGGEGIGEDTAYAGGMGQGGNAGQSYRKFKPKVAGLAENLLNNPIFTNPQRLAQTLDTIQQRMNKAGKGHPSIPHYTKAYEILSMMVYDPTEEQAAEFYKHIQKANDLRGVMEEQTPMFTPEDKMVNINDPGSDGWRVYKAVPSGILEGILKEYDDKAKVSLDENLLSTYGDQLGLDEDVYTNSLYKEFIDSEYNRNQGSYIDSLRNLGQFIRSKGFPEDKAKPLIRRLVAKLHPSGLNEEEQELAELKCWAGYKRVPGRQPGTPGSCTKAESAVMKGIQSENDTPKRK